MEHSHCNGGSNLQQQQLPRRGVLKKQNSGGSSQTSQSLCDSQSRPRFNSVNSRASYKRQNNSNSSQGKLSRQGSHEHSQPHLCNRYVYLVLCTEFAFVTTCMLRCLQQTSNYHEQSSGTILNIAVALLLEFKDLLREVLALNF